MNKKNNVNAVNEVQMEKAVQSMKICFNTQCKAI